MEKNAGSLPATPGRSGKGLYVPVYLLPVYAALLLTLGWQGGQRWHEMVGGAALPLSVPVTASSPVENAPDTAAIAASLPRDVLPPLRYTSHVYASEGNQASISLNGQRYFVGDSPLPGLIIEQIQPDLTLFDFNGELFTLAALEDWPGGKIARAE